MPCYWPMTFQAVSRFPCPHLPCGKGYKVSSIKIMAVSLYFYRVTIQYSQRLQLRCHGERQRWKASNINSSAPSGICHPFLLPSSSIWYYYQGKYVLLS